MVELFHTEAFAMLPADVPSTVRVTPVDPRVMARLSDASTPPGIVAVVRTPETREAMPRSGSLVVLAGVGDPGNVGTLVRSATALGYGIVVIDGADPFGPKAVRASAGACYRARIVRPAATDGLRDMLRGAGRPVLGLAADAEQSLEEAAAEMTADGCVLVLGSEPHGLSPATRTMLDGLVRIPMSGEVESLNVAAAGAIAMYALAAA